MDEERARQARLLARRIAAGDEQALEAAYDAFSGVVYRQALALLGSASDAEDVLQEVFLKLVRRRGDPIRDLPAYLLTAARHQSLSILRRRGRETLEGDMASLDLPPASPHAEFCEAEAVREAL
jgi:RNA polymerase sigma-70 factor, ECF subfamily